MSKYEASSFFSSTNLLTQVPMEASGSRAQSQSILKLRNTQRSVPATVRFAPPCRAERRKTSTAPCPSNVKSRRPSARTPSPKHLYVPGGRSSRLAPTRFASAKARASAAALSSFVTENPKSAAFSAGPPWARGRSISNAPAPTGNVPDAPPPASRVPVTLNEVHGSAQTQPAIMQANWINTLPDFAIIDSFF